MPIWAPVGGRPGAAMNGHNTGAWSEVIRHTDTGADAGAPAASAAGGRRGAGWAGTAGLPAAGGVGVGRVGSWWPKSASRWAVSRPRRRAAGHASLLRVRLTPSGMVEAANAASWARSRRSGA